MHTSQAAKLAERIARSGRRLKAIFITHPDLDHYLGLAVLHARFPEARIYMIGTALAEFKRSSAEYLARQKKNAPAETPEGLPAPEAVPATQVLVRYPSGEEKLLDYAAKAAFAGAARP